MNRIPIFLFTFFSLISTVCAQNPPPTIDVAFEGLAPYAGTSTESDRVPNETMVGKVLCGYQGWFTADGDGSPRKWVHYGARGKFEPGFCSVDLWPDMSEMAPDEKYPTPFCLADGSTATVFSSQNPKTVRRHFQWMQDDGLDGVFLQRFPPGGRNVQGIRMLNNVLVNVRQSANETGRTWALMYDLSGKNEGEIQSIVMADWKRLVDKMKLGKDPNDKSYLRHKGKPVIAVWGIGFNDRRKYTLAECMELVKFLQDDPEYGGFCVMIGVPTYWRELRVDALDDPFLHEIIKQADIVSPWTVGRFGTPRQAENHVAKNNKPDMEWCKENGVDYLPVVFPGFSWQNLMRGRGREARLNAIPRLKGEFLETQYRANVEAGAVMIYQAMFDEIDEGTAIFKCTNDVPVGESAFADYEGLPSDFYLKIVGRWTKTLREKTAK